MNRMALGSRGPHHASGWSLAAPAGGWWTELDDSHAWDPLTDLQLSTRAFAAQAHLVHDLAHRYTGGRWVALGGGGYDWARVVPRSWAAVWAEMTGSPLPERIPVEWAARWMEPARSAGFWPLPDLLLDDPLPATPRRAEIEQTNRGRAESLRQLARCNSKVDLAHPEPRRGGYRMCRR